MHNGVIFQRIPETFIEIHFPILCCQVYYLILETPKIHLNQKRCTVQCHEIRKNFWQFHWKPMTSYRGVNGCGKQSTKPFDTIYCFAKFLIVSVLVFCVVNTPPPNDINETLLKLALSTITLNHLYLIPRQDITEILLTVAWNTITPLNLIPLRNINSIT